MQRRKVSLIECNCDYQRHELYIQTKYLLNAPRSRAVWNVFRFVEQLLAGPTNFGVT